MVETLLSLAKSFCPICNWRIYAFLGNLDRSILNALFELCLVLLLSSYLMRQSMYIVHIIYIHTHIGHEF